MIPDWLSESCLSKNSFVDAISWWEATADTERIMKWMKTKKWFLILLCIRWNKTVCFACNHDVIHWGYKIKITNCMYICCVVCVFYFSFADQIAGVNSLRVLYSTNFTIQFNWIIIRMLMIRHLKWETANMKY